MLGGMDELDGLYSKEVMAMDENGNGGETGSEAKTPRLSVHILLPEALDRRLARWTEKLPGASWPSWGGHVTLVPHFVSLGSVDDVRKQLEAVCLHEMPFMMRLGAPMVVKDATRPDYAAVFLGVESADAESVGDDSGSRVHDLREKLLDALEPLREHLQPQLVEQPFLPHITLALSISELEAQKLVRAMRADPVVAEFGVQTIWLIVQGEDFERFAIPLGGG